MDVKRVKLRVLFDSGSHRSFITAKALSKYKLKSVRTESLGIKVFGAIEAVTLMREVVELSLGSLHGNKNVKIEAFDLKDISSIPKIIAEIIKHNYKHKEHLVLRCMSG